MATVNINTIISKYVNKPSVAETNIALYTHIENYGGELNRLEKIAMENPKLAAIGNLNYSSPTNVRRAFITGNRVVLQVYKPFVRSGKTDPAGCWHEYKYKSDENIGKNAELMINYDAMLAEYEMQRNMGVEGEKPERMIVKGNIFNIFRSPWVLTNIEEIYIDWTALVTEEILQKYQDAYLIIQQAMENIRGGVLKSNLLQTIFENANGGNVKSIRNRYPRLKCIALISNLDSILEMPYDRGKTNTDAYTEYGKFWLELDRNVELIKQSNSLIIINKITDGIEVLNKNFVTREGVYRYDHEILVDFFEDVKNRMIKYAREYRDGQQPEEVENTVNNEKTDIEIELDNIEAQNGNMAARMVLMLTFSNMKKSEVEHIKNSLTSEGKQKYI